MLMQPETFAEQPPRAAAGDRVADALACDDAELRRCAIRQAVPVGDETAERQAFALLPHAREIPVLPKSQVAAQTQASGPALRERLIPLCGSVWGLGGHERRVLNRRQAFASHAAAIGQRGFAALARIAVKKSVLPFAADFRWLILAFHKLIRLPSGRKTGVCEDNHETLRVKAQLIALLCSN